MPNEITIDVFDEAASEKKFDDIEKNANKDVSFKKSDIADKMGIKEEDLNIPGDNNTPGIEVIRSIQSTDLRTKVMNAMSELRAEQLTGGQSGYSSLTPDQKTQVDIELGKVDKDDFVNNEKKDWMYNATHEKTRGGEKVATGTQIINYKSDGSTSHKNLNSQGALKDSAEDQNKSHMIAKVGKNTTFYVNEDSKNDPNTANLFFNGKQSGIRMGKEGVHMTTTQAMNMVVGSCENVVVMGQSAKSVDGGYNLTINGPIKIYAKGDIFVATDGNMNFTSQGSINFQCNGNFNINAKGNVSVVSNGETAINADGKLSLLTEDSLQVKSNGGCAFGGQGDVSLKGSGNVNIDGATVNINGGASEDASPTKLAPFAVPTATPTKPVVPML